VLLVPAYIASRVETLPRADEDNLESLVSAVTSSSMTQAARDPRTALLLKNTLTGYRDGTGERNWAAALDKVDGWDWGMPRWEDILQRFVDREGHANVPSGHLEDGHRLGMWVHSSRSQKVYLPDDLIEFLDALSGWTWERAALGCWATGLLRQRWFKEARIYALTCL
jgi:hypothetical protein